MRLTWLVLFAAAAVAHVAAQDPPVTRIRIRVLDAAGRPLGDAVARIGPADEVTTAQALAHPDARSSPEGLLDIPWPGAQSDRNGPVLLITAPRKAVLRCPGHAMSFAAPKTPVMDFGDVRLPDGVKLSGRLRGREGKPVAGARVVATDCLSMYPWMSPGFVSQAITAADGTFLLEGVFASGMALDVIADGYYRIKCACVGVGDPLDLQLTESGFVEGTLLDAGGQPATGTVSAQYEVLGAEAVVRPVSKGAFRLPVLEPGRFRVNAWNRLQWLAESPVLSGPATGVTVRIAASAVTEHTVRAVSAATGTAVQSFHASACWRDDALDDSAQDLLEWSLQPSRDGAVVLQHGQWDGKRGAVHVTADGYAPATITDVEWDAGAVLVAKLLPECRIEGKVVDAGTGKPAAGASVTCLGVRKSEHSSSMRMPPVPIVAGADGSFAVGGLAAGSDYRLVAAHGDGTASVARTLRLDAREVRKDVELALPAGATVAGRITGGAPGPGWRMQLIKTGDAPAESAWLGSQGEMEAWNCEGAVAVGADGSFRFPHRAARTDQLLLVVPLPPRHGAALRIPVTSLRIGGDDIDREFNVADRLPGAITGKVTVTGAAFPACRLAIVATQVDAKRRDRVNYREQGLMRHWALVSGDGTFAVPAAPGGHRLEAIDVATGVVLMKADDTVAVAAGKDTARDLAVPVVEATICFEGDEQGRRSASLMDIATGARIEDRYGGGLNLFSGQSGAPNLDIRGRERELRCFVPPGRVRLRVDVGVSMLTHGSVGWSTEQPHAEETFECELGKPCRVTLKLPEPAALTDR